MPLGGYRGAEVLITKAYIHESPSKLKIHSFGNSQIGYSDRFHPPCRSHPAGTHTHAHTYARTHLTVDSSITEPPSHFYRPNQSD